VRMGTYTRNIKLKLLDQIWQLMRLRHYSLRTEEAHVGWNTGNRCENPTGLVALARWSCDKMPRAVS
jgi:hypothetical protein